MDYIEFGEKIEVEVVYGEFEDEEGYRWRIKDSNDETLGFSTVIYLARIDCYSTMKKVRDALDACIQKEEKERNIKY